VASYHYGTPLMSFPDWNFRWKHPVDSKIKIIGKGDTPVSVTSIPDITGKLWTCRPAIVPNTILLQGLSHTS
jgi:hypothetical protein